MKRILLSSLVLLLCSCTKSQNPSSQDVIQKLPYDSELTYVYEDLKDKEQAAMVGDVPVSWSQLRSQDPALKELESRYNQKALAFAYAYGLMSLEKKNEQGASVEVTFFGQQPEKSLKDVLSSMSVEFSENVKLTYEPAQTMAIAKVGDKTLTQTDFMNSHLSHSKLYRKVFNQRMQRLNGIVIRRHLLEASKAASMNMEAYVKEKILGPTTSATEEDVREFAKKRGISQGDLDEKMIDRLKAIVDQERRDEKIEAYIAKNLIKEPVKVAFIAPSINIKAPTLDDNIPQWGSQSDHNLLYVGHWNCEDCPSSIKSFLGAKEKWGKKINGAFIYSFPDRDREARMEAEAALCVFSQSKSFFWLFIDKMVSLPAEDNVEETINAAAQSTGADFEKFRQCFLKREFQQTVDTHLNYAKQMGVLKAPLLIIDGKVLESPVDASTLAKSIEMLPNYSGANKSFFGRIADFFANLF